MSCISSSKISMLINGTKTDFFKPSRGIRQGDPLSPYTFTISMEILSKLIHHEVDCNGWDPIKISTKGPRFLKSSSLTILSYSWMLMKKVASPLLMPLISYE